jgi:hypothetical protein
MRTGVCVAKIIDGIKRISKRARIARSSSISCTARGPAMSSREPRGVRIETEAVGFRYAGGKDRKFNRAKHSIARIGKINGLFFESKTTSSPASVTGS